MELDFERSRIETLLVFEPSTREIVGIFFTSPTKPKSVAPAQAAGMPGDANVEELLLTVGTPALPLGATLTLPHARGDTRLPAVLIVGGSGPVDRDCTMQGVKPYRDLAHGLARENVVTLRYDKRTFTYPREAAKQVVTVDDEVIVDAVSAVNTLRTRPEVDPSRIFVLGHSLGALLAPEIAARSGDVAGLVLIAAAGRPVPELLLEQLRERGEKPADLALLERQIKALPTLPADQPFLGVAAAYWQDLARRDEVHIARTLGVPIIYLRGALDRNVFSADQAKWAQAFAGDPHFESVTLPELNHLLLPASAGLSDDVHVADAAVARIAAFVTR